MPAIIRPEFRSKTLLDKHIIFLYFSRAVINSKKTAALQNGTATVVKKNNGIPDTVNPISARRDANDMQILWHT